MAFEYAIEKLLESPKPEDHLTAGILQNILEQRDGVDIQLPGAPSSELVIPHWLPAHAGRIALVDPSNEAPSVMSADQLDLETTKRFNTANTLKLALQPIYDAAAMKLPLHTDEPKTIFGNPKGGHEDIKWSVDDGSPNHRQLKLRYDRGKLGGSPAKLSSHVHNITGRHKLGDPQLHIEFENDAASAVHFRRGQYDRVAEQINLGGYSFFDEVTEFDISLNPTDLSLSLMYRIRWDKGAVDTKKHTANYEYNASTGRFETEAHHPARIGESGSLPTNITINTAHSLIVSLAKAFIPTERV